MQSTVFSDVHELVGNELYGRNTSISHFDEEVIVHSTVYCTGSKKETAAIAICAAHRDEIDRTIYDQFVGHERGDNANRQEQSNACAAQASKGGAYGHLGKLLILEGANVEDEREQHAKDGAGVKSVHFDSPFLRLN